jgi:hypothetical protein
VTEVIPFAILFGASSSQAVHPDRSDPKDRQRRVANDLLPASRELVLVAGEQGAQVARTRPLFADAKAALDAGRHQDCVRLTGRAVRAAAETMGPSGPNLLDGFELCFAMAAASVAGADVRAASHLFNGANAEMGGGQNPFGESWKALKDAVAQAGEEVAGRYRETVTALGGSAAVLSVAGGV